MGDIEVVGFAEAQEPRAASVPPNGEQKRFTIVVDGATNGDLIHAWSALCQVGSKPPSEEFRAVYPYLTTVQGNRFRFRGGNPDAIRNSLTQLLRAKLPGTVRARVET